MTGVIGHIANPTPDQAADLARAAEDAGAGWLGLADAFWWRDVWVLLAGAARATRTIQLGPAMTNPYLRHPFHTVSALATLQELAPRRVFCGIAAGGSEVAAAAGVSRQDAPVRTRELAELIRQVAAGQPLDAASGRGLDLALTSTPILVAARGDAMLRAAGAVADRVLLWAIPSSDLDRSAGLVRAGAGGRTEPPRLIWAPLVRHPEVPEAALGHVAVYAALNTHPGIRSSWGLDEEAVAGIRATLVAGGTAAAVAQVPAAALDDLVVDPDDAERVRSRAVELGVDELAVPGFGVDTVAEQLRWASAIEADLVG